MPCSSELTQHQGKRGSMERAALSQAGAVTQGHSPSCPRSVLWVPASFESLSVVRVFIPEQYWGLGRVLS